MNLCGLHHITMITGDARRNVDFYGEVLGLRLVKQTVNFDAPQAYHLYFGDEQGTPGSILTWFEFPGARRGRPGAGMIHTIRLGVRSPESLDFWAQRLATAGYDAVREGTGVRFADYDGLRFELEVVQDANPPLAALHPKVPLEHAVIDLVGARAYGLSEAGSPGLLTDTLGFMPTGPTVQARWRAARLSVVLRRAPGRAWDRGRGLGAPHSLVLARGEPSGLAGAGPPHRSVGHRGPRPRLLSIDLLPRVARRPVRDRTLFPGFAIDEDPRHLGEALKLPKSHEHLRPQLERLLTPIVSPRERREATPA